MDLWFAALSRGVSASAEASNFMDDVIVARALHVLAVVIWIGGVSMATTVALPAVRRGDLGEDRLKAFQAIEHRFVWQARSAIIVVGLSGFYMIWRLGLWDRFRVPSAAGGGGRRLSRRPGGTHARAGSARLGDEHRQSGRRHDGH